MTQPPTPASVITMPSARAHDTQIAERFGRYTLPDVLVALNDAVRQWAHGELVTAIPAFRDAGGKHPMFDWAAAETARYALLHCARPMYESPIVMPTPFRGWQSLEPLLDAAVNAHLAAQVGDQAEWEAQLLAEPLHNTMGAIWLPQFILQRRSQFRIGQVLLLYGEAARQRAARDASFSMTAFDLAVRRALGVDIDMFLTAVVQTCGRAAAEAKLSTLRMTPTARTGYDDVIFGKGGDGLLVPQAHASVFRLLSETPENMVRWSAKQLEHRTGTISAPADRGPNPLLRYPLVRCFRDKTDYCVAPVPLLLLEWLYEPLVDQLFAACDATFTRHNVSALFEEYVGLLAQKCSPAGTRWVPESELKGLLPSGRKVVDWAFVGGDYVVLVDAKRCFVHPAARYRWLDADWASTQKEMGKGVHQACDFWQAVGAGLVPQLGACTQKKAFALVVTQGDASFHAARDDWRAGIEHGLDPASRVPWAVLSLDDYEKLMSAWFGRDDAWLRAALERLAAGELVRDIVDGQIDERSPLVLECSRFVERLGDALLDSSGPAA